ncbi:MAG: hypothetical protein KGI26_02375 [Thaumarchaeota archaeon]|nr:hypothetical protein [Nitrososphaerota archaeon]
MAPRGPTKFVADAMLGSLARKLRALGFDASYYRSGDDAGLLEAAAREGRVVLTSDRELAARASARGTRAVLLTERTDGARLSAMARACRGEGIALVRGDPLCSVCGGTLKALRRADVSGMVPPSVEKRHRAFFSCEECGKLYWRGSHWKKLRSMSRRLN